MLDHVGLDTLVLQPPQRAPEARGAVPGRDGAATCGELLGGPPAAGAVCQQVGCAASTGPTAAGVMPAAGPAASALQRACGAAG